MCTIRNKNKSINVVGVMSGTSLDGLDIALCKFIEKKNKWNYKIVAASTLPYSPYWKKTLKNIHEKSAEELLIINNEYGGFIGKEVAKFLSSHKKNAHFISSHGHTIFHQPQNKFTFQLGHGATIAAAANLPVVCDFRSQDIALGGQGAPLVPIGDYLLFSKYKYCLNIGGIANISFQKGNNRIAYDICVANIILNAMASKFNKEFDKDGNEGKKGEIISQLLSRLNKLEYYSIKAPKSLAREDIEKTIIPLLSKYQNKEHDVLRTLYEHIATQISNELKSDEVLITGGGAKNKFLIELIKAKSNSKIIIPNHLLIDFKEALIFAFLGLLKIKNKNNVLSSVTGSIADHSSGVIYTY
jgi:anhydro-N-acetylmuramic acid kinase